MPVINKVINTDPLYLFDGVWPPRSKRSLYSPFAQMDDGTLVVLMKQSAGGRGPSVVLYKSTDDGQTWSNFLTRKLDGTHNTTSVDYILIAIDMMVYKDKIIVFYVSSYYSGLDDPSRLSYFVVDSSGRNIYAGTLDEPEGISSFYQGDLKTVIKEDGSFAVLLQAATSSSYRAGLYLYRGFIDESNFSCDDRPTRVAGRFFSGGYAPYDYTVEFSPFHKGELFVWGSRQQDGAITNHESFLINRDGIVKSFTKEASSPTNKRILGVKWTKDNIGNPVCLSFYATSDMEMHYRKSSDGLTWENPINLQTHSGYNRAFLVGATTVGEDLVITRILSDGSNARITSSKFNGTTFSNEVLLADTLSYSDYFTTVPRLINAGSVTIVPTLIRSTDSPFPTKFVSNYSKSSDVTLSNVVLATNTKPTISYTLRAGDSAVSKIECFDESNVLAGTINAPAPGNGTITISNAVWDSLPYFKQKGFTLKITENSGYTYNRSFSIKKLLQSNAPFSLTANFIASAIGELGIQKNLIVSSLGLGEGTNLQKISSLAAEGELMSSRSLPNQPFKQFKTKILYDRQQPWERPEQTYFPRYLGYVSRETGKVYVLDVRLKLLYIHESNGNKIKEFAVSAIVSGGTSYHMFYGLFEFNGYVYIHGKDANTYSLVRYNENTGVRDKSVSLSAQALIFREGPDKVRVMGENYSYTYDLNLENRISTTTPQWGSRYNAYRIMHEERKVLLPNSTSGWNAYDMDKKEYVKTGLYKSSRNSYSLSDYDGIFLYNEAFYISYGSNTRGVGDIYNNEIIQEGAWGISESSIKKTNFSPVKNQPSFRVSGSVFMQLYINQIGSQTYLVFTDIQSNNVIDSVLISSTDLTFSRVENIGGMDYSAKFNVGVICDHDSYSIRSIEVR